MSSQSLSNSDLPQRTWKQWWRQLPGYWRIGAWSLLGMALLHALLAVRIWYGLQEPSEIVAFRVRNFHILYDSDRRVRPAPVMFLRKMTDGLKGRSGRDVVLLHLGSDGTDEDLRMIADVCPNLETLSMHHGTFSAEGLAHLSRCRKLHSLDLTDSNVDDAALANINRISTLENLDLTETLVSDASLPALRELPDLTWIILPFTDVSLSAIQEWRASSPRNSLGISTEWDQQPDAVIGAICWSDGRRSAHFFGSWVIALNSDVGGSIRSSDFALLSRHELWWPPQTWDRGDGDYRLTLTLNGLESQPVTVVVRNGKPDLRTVEFVMPVTLAKALETSPDTVPGK